MQCAGITYNDEQSKMSKTIYNPKTLLRLYDVCGTYLSTAVVLNDGNILEVKNADGKEKGQYSCIEAWQETRPVSTLEVDATNASKIAPIRHRDKFGFTDQYGSRWTQWLLSMMYEGTPHLIEREDVRNAYNNLTNLLARHSAHIHFYCRNFRLPYKYYADNLRYDTYSWNGLPVCWNGAPPEGKDDIMQVLTNAYKALYDLIGKDVRTYMKKKSDIAQATSDLKYYNKKSYMTGYRVRRLREEADKLQKKWDEFNKKIEECKKIISS